MINLMLSKYPFITPKEKSSFAYFTVTTRLPKIVKNIINGKIYENGVIVEKLQDVLNNLPNLKVRKLEHTSKEVQYWKPFYDQYLGKSIQEIPFFFGEIYFYGLINEIVEYGTLGIDPFGKIKNHDIENNVEYFQQTLNQFKNTKPGLKAYLDLCLAGNKADLSQLHVSDNQNLRLILDHSNGLMDALSPESTVHFILDNAGVELFSDLVLIEHLLSTSKVGKVVLHAKRLPLFVSDATIQDIEFLLRTLRNNNADIFVKNLEQEIQAGKLSVQDHIFWNTPNHFTDLPNDLLDQLENEDVFLTKGDANYRRYFEDRDISPTTPVHHLCGYIPFKAFALRTLKSEIQVGLDLDQVNSLFEEDKDWMTNGKYAVIQKVSF